MATSEADAAALLEEATSELANLRSELKTRRAELERVADDRFNKDETVATLEGEMGAYGARAAPLAVRRAGGRRCGPGGGADDAGARAETLHEEMRFREKECAQLAEVRRRRRRARRPPVHLTHSSVAPRG